MGESVFPMIWLLVAVPSVVIWLVAGWLTPIGRKSRIAVSCLTVGLVYSGLIMWDDAAEGFCCREYYATVWTEMALYVPLALCFALLGCLTLVAIQWLADLLLSRFRQ